MTHWPATTLPYGVVRTGDGPPRPATAVGGDAIDLAGAARAGLLDGAFDDPLATLDHPTLDRLLAAGPDAWSGLRARLLDLLHDPAAADRIAPLRRPLADVQPVLAWTVADYVDFYSSRDHARNVGRIFRPDAPQLPAAWDHLPIGYHGRAGTVVVSGTEVVRPTGLRRDRSSGEVVSGPSRHLDLEVELGWVVGVGSDLGTTVPTTAFADHVFGAVLVNDWSARDLQAFEYVPLGPFLGKSFATSVAPWIVPLAALEHARIPPPDPPVPPAHHLAPAGDGYAIDLELAIAPDGQAGTVVATPHAAGLRWTPAQQLAHLTSNGACLRSGDLYASGTVSGPTREERGSLLELTWGWTEDVVVAGGSRRDGLHDGDSVIIRGTAPGVDGAVVPLGEVSGRIAPAAGSDPRSDR
ncbi:fumarylacetoacetate hydrolase family protein [Nitriliruptor alkaliphilus]|uniref:fumarylacetoacetate hydrolase family protein n=1 Tax=Nitriliruptor alkaliphilus TaxID=427918 RepID=UPI000AAEA8C5|nr:fumarylacetoacetate hydrolase family protein [Nitriliruptor alkaliphilus]